MGLWDQVFFAVIVIFGPFHFEDDLPHGLDDEGGMLAGGGLGAEHDGVGAFEDGVSDVGDLAAVGLHAVDHAFHHLGGYDDGFCAVDTFSDDLALGHGYFFDGQFDAEITISLFRHNGHNLLQAVLRDVSERRRMVAALEAAKEEAEMLPSSWSETTPFDDVVR